jgi:hypothetical protein
LRYVKISFSVFIVMVLTLITQVGGIVFILSFAFYPLVDKNFHKPFIRLVMKLFSFLILYLLTIFVAVPLIAKPLGRVPLPMTETHHVRPANLVTFFFCRNYVRPLLRETVFKVGDKMNSSYPGTIINYLDAGFPFINKFPLPPHLSHHDGKKLDISFFYKDSKTNARRNDVPSPIGYGICEGPKQNEENMPAYCARQGAWQYSLLSEIIDQSNGDGFVFDSERTRSMVNFFASQSAIARMYMEPHLKTRLGLKSEKIRFHGCIAVRHDDHLHIQIV